MKKLTTKSGNVTIKWDGFKGKVFVKKKKKIKY